MSVSSDGGRNSPYRILCVDDEPDLERLVRQRMRREIRSGKFEMEFAHNGVEALEMLGQSRFDMVLSDINMPRMDGLTLLSQIPNVDSDIRAVIVSAYGDMANIRTAMNRGAFDFVTKPIDFDDLRVTIDRTLENLTVWREALASRDQLVALEQELNVARRMQTSILPTEFPEKPDYNVHGHMEAAKAVGGDFYDVVGLEHGRLGVTIADVSGKGVPAALFMMSSRTLLKGSAIGSRNPADVLRDVNSMLVEENPAMMFVTMLYAVFNPETGEFAYASGGHDSPIVVRADGTATVLPRADGIALGVLDEAEFTCNTAMLQPGETALLYTDGVSEAQNLRGEQFGINRICEVFAGDPPENAEQATAAVFQAVTSFAGNAPQFDDITCLALRRSGLAK